MTLEEKAAQMLCVWQKKPQTLIDENGNFDPAKAQAAFGHGHGLGQVGRPSDAGGVPDPRRARVARNMAELTNAIQRFFIENSRLGIPVIFHEECLHGHAANDATSFPQPIGLGATFHPELIEKLFEMTAAEVRARGGHHALTPVVDVARDPRWGRVEETYGEDPFLVSKLGVAAVRGFQGDATFQDRRRLVATLKHFAAHGQPESGMNCGPVNVSERVLRETFLRPFQEAIQQGGAMSVMASYNEIDGVPSHASRWLLRKVLREEWGFQGFVVSDYFAIAELHHRADAPPHAVAASKAEACRLAVEAGVNIELPDPDCYELLIELVHSGVLREEQLDALILPMLECKFRLGLFENPYVDPDEADALVGCAAHRQLALQAARETITLLKNDAGAAPLNLDSLNTIAVIGPNADRLLLGGYSGIPKNNVTVLEGIRQRAAGHAEVLYSEGCKITLGGSWNQDEVTPSDPAEDRRQIAEAVQVAQRADVIVLAIGGNEQTSREAWSYTHMGDRAQLGLVGRQEELLDALAATGKPIIVFLFNGRPLVIDHVAEKAAAVFECWYLGQETGAAVAEVLFGDYNPGGKLPISIPRSAGHLPVFYNHKPTARRGYLFDDSTPLYPFGFGLSYTSFSLANLRLSEPTIPTDGATTVFIDVTNTGPRYGSETVQIYIRDRFSSVTRPVKELKGFERVWLQPGESRTLSFEIWPEHLAFYNVDMKFTVEPGEFDIMAGTSSQDSDLQRVLLVVK
jgi:beta-glucosidase